MQPLGSPRLCIIINEARQSLLSVAAPEVLVEPRILGSDDKGKSSSSIATPEEGQKGNLEPFLQALKTVGPDLFEDEDIRKGLKVLWWQAQQGKDRQGNYYYPGAQEHLKQIGEALAWVGGGASERLTEAQKKQTTRVGNKQAKQDSRTLQYYDRAWERYLSKKEELASRGIRDEQSLRQAAENIASKEFSRKTDAKEEAQRLFWQEVEKDLVVCQASTVRKN